MIHPSSAPVRLHEEDAWAIAMTWKSSLLGHVRFVTDREDPMDSICESYAWIYLETDMTTTHAVLSTWITLASCRGYRGQENPVFWKRVISALQETDYDNSLDVPTAVADQFGFFNRPGYGFPRFSLPYINGVDRKLHPQFNRLFTHKGPDLDEQTKHTVDSILTRLGPFLDREEVPYAVDIRLEIPTNRVDAVAIASLVHIVNDQQKTTRQSIVRPFRIHKLLFRKGLTLGEEDENGSDQVLLLLQNAPVFIGPLTVDRWSNAIEFETRARWIRAFLRVDDQDTCAKCTILSLLGRYLDQAVFQALISALPFATSLHSLRQNAEGVRRLTTFEKVELPWVAYALFHPYARTSSWRHLRLTELFLTRRSHEVLSAMARGNNLLALLNGKPPDANAYYRTELLPGTSVMLAPSSTSNLLYTAPDSMAGNSVTVDVCDVTSVDPSTWNEWVAVLVPAYGLGYVQRHNLTSIEAHSPSRKPVFGMTLAPTDIWDLHSDYNDPPKVVLHLLTTLGPILTYLDMVRYKNTLTSTLFDILRSCPSLKVLKVNHSGHFWSEQDLNETKDFPLIALEELQLHLNHNQKRIPEPSPEFLRKSLCHLRALCISLWEERGEAVRPCRNAIKLLLKHAVALEYFHWNNKSFHWIVARPYRPLPYAQTVEATMLTQKHLRLQQNDLNRLHVSRCARVTALINVMDHKRHQNPTLGHLVNANIFSHIFEFEPARGDVRGIILEPGDPRHSNRINCVLM